MGWHSDTLIFGAVWIAAFQILNFLKEKLEIKVYKIATIKKILLKARCRLSKHIFQPKLGLELKSVC